MRPPSTPRARPRCAKGGSWALPNAGAPEGAGRRGACSRNDGGGSRIKLETQGGRRQDERQSSQGCRSKGTGVGRTRAERDAVSAACLQRSVCVCVSVCLQRSSVLRARWWVRAGRGWGWSQTVTCS